MRLSAKQSIKMNGSAVVGACYCMRHPCRNLYCIWLVIKMIGALLRVIHGQSKHIAQQFIAIFTHMISVIVNRSTLMGRYAFTCFT